MINNDHIQASNRSTIAKRYGVGLRVFNQWIKVNADLAKVLKPYISKGKRTLPPAVVKKVYEILGEF